MAPLLMASIRLLFNFDNTLNCYKNLANYLWMRINNTSSLYQMFGVMCDLFYYDHINQQIILIEDLTLQYVLHQLDPRLHPCFSSSHPCISPT
jgi:hypothetical protein